MSELDELLSRHSELVSAGAGHFTVDPRRQRELLAKLGLQNTAQGFLKLCQGIYRSGATRVLFFTAKNELQIVIVHAKPFPENLLDLAEPLGVALLNLSQEYRIDWVLRHSNTVSSGHIATDSCRMGPAESVDPEVDLDTRIVITRPASRWWHRDWTTTVRRELASKLCWNGVCWCWNDESLPKSWPLSLKAQAVVFAEEGLPGELDAGTAGAARIRRLRSGDTVIQEEGLKGLPLSGPAHAILGATRNSWSETFFVLDGVLLEGERNLLDRPGVMAIVSADGLTPALSGLELVHDAAFRQRLQGLRPEVSWLDEINQRA